LRKSVARTSGWLRSFCCRMDSSHVSVRPGRFILRDFTYDEEAIEKQKRDLIALEESEKELWVCL
jgi:hypothetical protein